jgi:glutathione S-transferase
VAGDRWHSLPRPCDPSVGGISKRNHRVRFAGHGAVRPTASVQNDIWVERFWATLQAEVLDRQHLEDLAAADAAVTAYASYYNYHRLHGELGWRTPAERFDGTPFLDRGFEHVPSLAAVAPLLAELLAA